MIEINKLTKNFGGERGVFKLDLFIEQGTIMGFIGPNGAGKTTSIKCLCGLHKPDSGTMKINGINVEPKNYKKIKQNIGYMPDIFGVYDQMSVWEYLDFFGAAYKIPAKTRKKRVEYVLELCRGSHMIDYQVTSLSRGMRQRIGLAKTLLHDPKVLILDEPAGGLDPHARIEMREIIISLRELGKTIMLSSHMLSELGTICDTVAIIEHGILLANGPVEEVTHELQSTLTYVLRTDSDIEYSIGILNAIQEIDNIKSADDEIFFSYNGARADIANIVPHLVENQIRILSFNQQEMNLESVFMQLTGHGKK